MATTYTAKDITVLEGLEPVRKRPGMYIGGVGSTGLHHLVWEILDNSIDEAMNGYASNIAVTLHEDGTSITIADDGRGIPVDKHPKTKKSALEVIFSTLHAGGKFEAGNYKTAGGLHGVGASVVNALSKELVATVRRDGSQWEMRFKQGAMVGALKKIGPARGTGTTVFFRPDTTIFPKVDFDADLIRQRLEVSSYLHKGVKIVFENEATGAQGRLPALRRARRLPEEDSRGALGASRCTKRRSLSRRRATRAALRLDLALQWTQSTDEHVRSYVNGIPTGFGRHRTRTASAPGLGKAVRNFIETHNLSPKGVTLTAEDIREGMVVVLSVFVQEPQFQGQTKDRLNNPEVMSAVDSQVRPALEHWLNTNISVAESIIARVILSARAREASRAAQQEVVRKSATSSRLTLPGKLSDCSSSDRDDSEIFIVEGDSAGGSAKQGRDRARQAILPLRGKVLNTESASLAKVLENKELTDLGHRARQRAREELRPLTAALRPDHHPGRRRFRRAPHRDAAPDVHLPAHAGPHHRRPRVPRAAAALPDRHRQGNLLGARRCPPRPDSQAARQRPRQARDHAVQRPWRDDAEGPLGDDHEPAEPDGCCASRSRTRSSPIESSTS